MIHCLDKLQTLGEVWENSKVDINSMSRAKDLQKLNCITLHTTVSKTSSYLNLQPSNFQVLVTKIKFLIKYHLRQVTFKYRGDENFFSNHCLDIANIRKATAMCSTLQKIINTLAPPKRKYRKFLGVRGSVGPKNCS